jgi:hypothetical protein
VAVNKSLCIFMSQGTVYSVFQNPSKHERGLPKYMYKAEISEEKIERTVNKPKHSFVFTYTSVMYCSDCPLLQKLCL